MSGKSIVILTGAGISAESGIPLFRGDDGLWENHRVEDVATMEGFIRNPELVQSFYNGRRRKLLGGDVRPNAAHVALAKLEREYPGEVLLITQNIDDLHERGGSGNIIHMHGELLKARCLDCDGIMGCHDDLGEGSPCDFCESVGRLRPHVVWFGEIPLELDRIFGALSGCGTFISVGTSGQVYPAAGFVEVASRGGALCIECNREDTAISRSFDRHHVGPASEVVPEVVDDLLHN